MLARSMVISAALAVGATGAAAQTGLQAWLRTPGVCFSRTYDAAHLRAHPRQTVQTFFLGDAGPAWRASVQPGEVALAFGFRLAGRRDVYHGVAVCTPGREEATCYVEGDGGSFRVLSRRTGVRVVIDRVQLEGERDVSPDLAEGDNRVMLLNAAPQARCAQP